MATDAGASRPLAWVGTGAAAFLVTLGPGFRSPTPVHCGVALLGAMLLLRQDARLMLAPLYGAGLLLVEELAWRSIELRDIEAIGPGVITARVTAVLGGGGGRRVRGCRRSDRGHHRAGALGHIHRDRCDRGSGDVRHDRTLRSEAVGNGR